MRDRLANCVHCSELIDDLELHLLDHEKAGRFTGQEQQSLRKMLGLIRKLLGEDVHELAPRVWR